MASLKYYLDTRRAKQDNKYPLKIKVSLNSRNGFMINLKVSLWEDQWNGIEITNHPNKKPLNSYIKRKYADVEDALYRLELSGDIYRLSPREVKERLEHISGLKEKSFYTFKDHFRRFIDLKEKPGTKGIYQLTLNKIEQYDDRMLHFQEINVPWLKGFEHFLKEQEISTNTINLHFRNIRAVFNDAINEEKTELNCYPFRKFKLKTEPTRKRSLTVEQLRDIRDWPCEPHEKQYIDMFMLIFYLRGINLIDLAHLKEIVNGRVEYRRAKTGRLYSVKIEPEAMEIINRYRGKNYVVNILDRYKDHRNYIHRINKNLKEFGTTTVGRRGKKEKKGAFPELSTYWARHTWATIAAALDIPKETIAASLGHGETTVTDIYIDFDQRKVDEANREVIDYVSEIKRSK